VSDGSLTASDTFTVTINNVNDAPVVTVPGTQTVSVVTTGTTAQRTLTFSTLNAVSVTDPDSGTNNIAVTVSVDAGGTVAANATTGVTQSGSATALTLTGSQAAVRTALGTLRYISNTNFFGTSTITVLANDNGNSGSGGAMTDSKTITVNVNAAPTISGLAPTITVNEDGTTSTTFAIADDDGTVANIVTTATSSRPGLIANPTVSGTGATRTITLTPVGDQNSLRAGGDSTITITATDAVGGTVLGTFTLHVNQVNDAPVVTVPAAAQTGNEDGSITIASPNAISFTDIDAAGAENPSGAFLVTLGANSGAAITVNGTAGLGALTGNGTSNVSFTANLADANAALNGLTLRLPADQSTSTPGTLTVTVNDQGNGGTPANLQDTDTVSFVFNPVNDAPVQTNASGLVTLTTNTTRTGLHVDVADIDAGTTPVTLTLNSTQGTITLNTTTGLTFVTGTGTGDATIVATGTVAAVDAALDNFNFTPTTNFTGDARVEITTNDNGATGSGGALSATSNIFTTFTAIANTAPTISDIADTTVMEDSVAGPLSFTISDTQTSADNLNVTVTGGSAITATASLGGTAGNRTVTVTPAANFTGPVTFTVTVGDGSLTVMDSFTVTFTAVNDAPTLAAISDVTMIEDQVGGATVSFTALDVDNTLAIGNLAVTTDNPALLTIDNLVYNPATGAGSFRVTSAAGDSGIGNITVSASDTLLTAQRTFKVTVTAVNDAPTVSGSGQIVVNDVEQSVLRVRLSLSGGAGNVMSLGTIAGITFVDVGTSGSNVPDGTVDGDGVNDHLLGIEGTITALNAAMDDLVTSGGTLSIRVDDITAVASATDYAGTSGVANATRPAGVFGPNPVGSVRLYLRSAAASLPFSTTSQTATTAFPASPNNGVFNLGGGAFNQNNPGNSDVGQWLPASSLADNQNAPEITASVVQGWLYDADLAGQTINAGTWTINAHLADATGSTGRLFLRVSVVTGTAGNYTTVATITETAQIDGGNGGTLNGWDGDEDNRFTVGSNSTVNVIVEDATAHTFATGERLLVELGFGDLTSNSNHAWHLLYNDGTTWIQSPDIN
jgi:hypothetical protein